MKDDMYKQAKEIFFKYQGNAFFMERDYLYKTFKNYEIPQNILVEWYQELLLKNKKQLMSTKINSEIIDSFSSYLNLLRSNKEYCSTDDINFAFNFLYKSKKLDDFSILLMIDKIINFIIELNISEDCIKKYCKNKLLEMNPDSFTIDNSYKIDGQWPPYALKKSIAQKTSINLEKLNML